MLSFRKIFIVIFIAGHSLTAKAYSGDSTWLNKSNRYIIGASMGAAIPFLNFGVPSSTSVYYFGSQFSGYAKSGFHFNVNAEFLITPNFGIKGMVGKNQNSYNTTAYNNSISYNDPGTTMVSANSYDSWEYLIGIFINAPFRRHPNLSFNFSVMGGCMAINFPTIVTDFSATSGQDAGESSISANNAKSFDGDFSLGLHDKINKHLNVSLDCSFSFAYMQFSNGIYTETVQGSPSISTTPSNPLNMWIGLFKPTISLGYLF